MNLSKFKPFNSTCFTTIWFTTKYSRT